MTKKLTRRAVVGGLAGLSLASKARAAAEWPTRTITIIHGFPAGGPSDVIARLIVDGLSRSLGQAVIVEPRPGASARRPPPRSRAPRPTAIRSASFPPATPAPRRPSPICRTVPSTISP